MRCGHGFDVALFSTYSQEVIYINTTAWCRHLRYTSEMDLMKLKGLLESHGITQTELARLLGRDKSVVTNLLQGRRQLKADEAKLIADVLGMPVGDLLGEARKGVEESGLIPFQHEPVKARRARQVVEKNGKFYLEDNTGFSSKAYALEVRDDGLNMAGVMAGDVVISELDRPCKAGQVVVAQHYVAGAAETIVRKYEPPFLLPHSTNPAFRPLHLERDDVRAVSPVLKLVRLF